MKVSPVLPQAPGCRSFWSHVKFLAKPGPHKGNQDFLSLHCPENGPVLTSSETFCKPLSQLQLGSGPLGRTFNFPILVLNREPGTHWELECL